MFYSLIDTKMGQIVIAGDEDGLRHTEFQHGLRALKINKDWKRNDLFLKPAIDQLNAYFKGELRQFDLSLAPEGTPFQKSVWNALLEIPYGEVVSYKHIAERIGKPKAARAVGSANGKNPLAVIVPCHRVIGADGSMTGYACGIDIKRQLLALEGVNIKC